MDNQTTRIEMFETDQPTAGPPDSAEPSNLEIMRMLKRIAARQIRIETRLVRFMEFDGLDASGNPLPRNT